MIKAIVAFGFGAFFVLGLNAVANENRVTLSSDRVLVDGKPAPFLYGSEIQYFRARGGGKKGVPRATVTKLWDTLLDRVEEAKMNYVQFYIPWDFHEPREGEFSFDGDNDYPSRDLKKFMEMVEKRGFKYVMVRPGPYINAEWGPTGFGAVPLWFLDNYPEALAKSKTAGKVRVVNFAHPIFKARVRKWFSKLYNDVLKNYIGPNRPVVFVQIDNETNYFWDSVYERDRSEFGRLRFQEFLKNRYQTTAALSEAYGVSLNSFASVELPRDQNDKTYPSGRWHYDWFLFHDQEIHDYYAFIKQAWKEAGLPEDQILWTSCDSVNAPSTGLVPRLDFRAKNQQSLTTFNIYPKTMDVPATLATPMKGAHDALLVAAAHDQFYGNAGKWVMSTETVGGWFPPTNIPINTLQHTYGALLGAGVKGMAIYYFHEGWNWTGKEGDDSELHFNAPLDKDMNRKPSYQLLKDLGTALQGDLGAAVMDTELVKSPVLIAHDAEAQYPWPGAKIDAVAASSDDAAALFGVFREAGATPEVRYLNVMSEKELLGYQLVVWSNPGYVSAATLDRLKLYVAHGGSLVVMGDAVPELAKAPRVTRYEKNPFSAWNTSQYLTTRGIVQLLGQAKTLLQKSGVKPTFVVRTEDDRPFLHVSLRKAQKRTQDLLIVENFLPAPRKAEITWGGAKVSLKKLYGTAASDTIACSEAGKGISVPVGADGVDIWEVTPCH